MIVGVVVALGGTAGAQRRPDVPLDNGQEINLAVGESRTISAKDVKNYSEGVVGVVDIKLTSDNSQFVINGRRPGSTTLLLIKSDGTQLSLNINVFLRSPQVVEKEINQLLGNIPGVQVRRVGARFVIDGTVASDTDMRRVQRVAQLYPDQVESLVQLAGAATPPTGPAGSDKAFLIRIDFYFVQYDRNSSYAVGITWPAAFGGPALQAQVTYDFLAGATQSATATLAGQPLPQLDLAARRGWAKVLKQATVITANDSDASFSNGGDQNFAVNTGLTIGIQSIHFGTDLTVLPHYEPGKRELNLKLTADVADLSASAAGTNLPGRSTSKLSTRITLKLGQSLILSGIRTQSIAHAVSGLPLLSEIPVLGLLFGSHSQTELQTEGAIFLVPSVIESVPTSGAELVDYALQRFKAYDGDISSVNAYDKRPGGGVGIPR
jgi:pilus assembly protein CpaC